MHWTTARLPGLKLFRGRGLSRRYARGGNQCDHGDCHSAGAPEVRALRKAV